MQLVVQDDDVATLIVAGSIQTKKCPVVLQAFDEGLKCSGVAMCLLQKCNPISSAHRISNVRLGPVFPRVSGQKSSRVPGSL